MSTQLNLDTDVKTLSQNQLEELRQLCWNKDSEISNELSRRASMPFIWESELASVRMIRSAMKNEPKPFDEWKKPTSIVDAYIIGDTVTYKGKRYLAQGQGALMYAPDGLDPIQGFCWVDYDEGDTPPVDFDPNQPIDDRERSVNSGVERAPESVEGSPEAELYAAGFANGAS